MDTKSLMWVILGLILIAGGIASSLKEGRQATSQSSVSSGARISPAADNRLIAAPTSSPEKKIDTGFQIDPIKGLRRKEANEEYFK